MKTGDRRPEIDILKFEIRIKQKKNEYGKKFKLLNLLTPHSIPESLIAPVTFASLQQPIKPIP